MNESALQDALWQIADILTEMSNGAPVNQDLKELRMLLAFNASRTGKEYTDSLILRTEESLR